LIPGICFLDIVRRKGVDAVFDRVFAGARLLRSKRISRELPTKPEHTRQK
jgi:hypothetical protein